MSLSSRVFRGHPVISKFTSRHVPSDNARAHPVMVIMMRERNIFYHSVITVINMLYGHSIMPTIGLP